MARTQDVKKFARCLERAGYTVEPTKKAHLKVRLDGRYVFMLSISPSDVNWLDSAVRLIRRLDLPMPKEYA